MPTSYGPRHPQAAALRDLWRARWYVSKGSGSKPWDPAIVTYVDVRAGAPDISMRRSRPGRAIVRIVAPANWPADPAAQYPALVRDRPSIVLALDRLRFPGWLLATYIWQPRRRENHWAIARAELDAAQLPASLLAAWGQDMPGCAQAHHAREGSSTVAT